MNTLKKIWDRLFLQERPSISLSLFRLFVAFTVMAHVLPSFFHMADNYYPTAFKTWNGSFFTAGVLHLVAQSPVWLINFFAAVFCLFSFFFLVGFLSQISCILTTVACYYFYALNSFHVGTLSWDILLVTLFLMCLTPYHGDYFSVDAFLWGEPDRYRRHRPYFIQRLLQIQIGMTFFHTGLTKVWPAGNWFSDNPLYYVMNYPPEGTTKMFLLRDWLRTRPEVCLHLGHAIVILEFLMFFLLAWRKTRISAIYLGILFHILLILTLDVPATFFFLFPAQLCLFLDPRDILRWIERRRLWHASATKPRTVIYDGDCGVCKALIKRIQMADLFAVCAYVPYQSIENFAALHPTLTQERCQYELVLAESGREVFGGFDAVRRLCFSHPPFYPLLFLFYFPGMGIIGSAAYKIFARFRSKTSCQLP